MKLVVVVVAAGAIGAPVRFMVDGFVERRVAGVFPWGTFGINVSGSLLLGVVVGLAHSQGLGDLPKTAIGAGFCGAYTTFSTFSYETIRLLEEGLVGLALGNVLGSVVVGLLAAAAGLAISTAV